MITKFTKDQIVEIEQTELNLSRFVKTGDKIIGKIIKNKGQKGPGLLINDPVDVQIKKKVGKTIEAIFSIDRSEIKSI